VAVEVDGGGWVQGAHHRKKGRDNDNEKDREAQLMGWQVFRFDWDMVKDGTAIGVVRRAVEEAR
jgi:very-short-patch-repair endonuclease